MINKKILSKRVKEIHFGFAIIRTVRRTTKNFKGAINNEKRKENF